LLCEPHGCQVSHATVARTVPLALPTELCPQSSTMTL